MMMDADKDTLCTGEYGDESVTIIASKLTRRDARAFVFHLLYAMDSFDYDVSLESIADNFSCGFGFVIEPHDEIFKEAAAIIEQRKQLDEEFRPLLDNWRFDRLGVCTRLIIRLAIWEFLNTDTDRTVIINEAIELAKCFAELDAYKFINGVLDEWVKRAATVAQE